MKRMRGIGLVLAIMMAVAMLGAALTAEAEGSAALEITYVHKDASAGEETAIAGATFRLYKVATGAATQGKVPEGGFKLTSAFAGSGVGLAGPDQAAWRGQALALEGYVATRGLAADASGETDAAGELALATGLEPGLYLLLGDRVEQGEYAYLATPALVAVQVEDQGKALALQPKHVRVPLTEPAKSVKAVKIWDDAGAEYAREPVEVVLLRDGAEVGRATLNATNSWSYEWADLDGASAWLVAEAPPAPGSVWPYEVSVEEVQEGVFWITNSAKPCLIDPPVKKLIHGDRPEVNATFRFVMEAVSNTAGYAVAEMPMPEGSVNGKKTYDLKGAGEFEFGEIRLMKPGTYVYRLYEDATTKSAGYTYDTTEYTVTAVVTADADGNLSAETETTKREKPTTAPTATPRPSAGVTATATPVPTATPGPEYAASGMRKSVFINGYAKTTTPPVTPQPTGGKPSPLPQTGQIWWPVPVLALAGVAFVVIGLARRKREDR